MIRRIALIALAAAGVLAVDLAAAQTTGQEVQVRTWVDRTALWVGDRVVYTIEIACQRGVDVLADDVGRDKLKLEGLEVVDSSTDRESAADGGTRYRFRYVLTTYRTDTQTLSIAPLRVRYAVRRAGQRLEDAAPAGDVEAPGATLALRSVLPEDPGTAAIRSDKPPPPRRPLLAALQSIGIALVIISIVPAAMAAAGWIRRAAKPRLRRSARAVRHDEHASLEAVRAMPLDTVDRRREAFTKLETLVREHLRDVAGVEAAGLTPADVAAALAGARLNGTGELVAEVLGTCERARYGPAQATPSADECRSTIDRVGQILSA